jgi:archaemetzincin
VVAEVELWWIGTAAADTDLLEDVRRRLAEVFGADTALALPEGRPPSTFDPRRRQHASSAFLRWLGGAGAGPGRRVLAVTDVDLFMPVLTFVFGEAQLGGRAAVVSTARLAAEGGHRRDVLRARLATEAVHELGHTFGLVHCERPACAMHRSAGLRDVDRKRAELCPDCRRRLQAIVSGEERTHDDAPAHPDPGGR